MGVQLRRLGPHTRIKPLSVTENQQHVWTAGRGSDCEVFTASKYASRRHFSIIYKGKKFFLLDHGSSNGTFLNEEKIKPLRKYPLALESTISVGVPPNLYEETDHVVFVFELCQEENKNDNAAEQTSAQIVPEKIKTEKPDSPKCSACGAEEVRVKEEPNSSRELCDASNSYSANVHKSEIDLFTVDDDDDEIGEEEKAAYGAVTQEDTSANASSQMSYSVTEELIEIDDSDDDWQAVVKKEFDVEEKYAPPSALKQEEEEYEDDVIFLDNIVKSPCKNPPVIEIDVEDEENYSEVDKKWLEKLFKTKEERDSFIQSQKEENEDNNNDDDDDDDYCVEVDKDEEDWLKLVTRCAEEIGQILESEEKNDDKIVKEEVDEQECSELNPVISPAENVPESRVGDPDLQDKEIISSVAEGAEEADVARQTNLQIKVEISCNEDTEENAFDTLIKPKEEISHDDGEENVVDALRKPKEEISHDDGEENVIDTLRKPKEEISTEDVGVEETAGNSGAVEICGAAEETAVEHARTSREGVCGDGEESAVEPPRKSQEEALSAVAHKDGEDRGAELPRKSKRGNSTVKSQAKESVAEDLQKSMQVATAPSTGTEETGGKAKESGGVPEALETKSDNCSLPKKKPRIEPPAAVTSEKRPNEPQSGNLAQLQSAGNAKAPPKPSNENGNVGSVAQNLDPSKKKKKKKSKKKKKKQQQKLQNIPEPFPLDRERIRSLRKRKLMELSMKEGAAMDAKKMNLDPKPMAPLKVKFTRNNRSNFLCQGAEEYVWRTQSYGTESLLGRLCESGLNNVNYNAMPMESNQVFAGSSTGGFYAGVAPQLPLNTLNPQWNFGENAVNLLPQRGDQLQLKSCLKKFGYSFMKSNRPIVAKKMVRFDTTKNVRCYEVENTKLRKVTSLQKAPSPAECWTRFENIFNDICGWNAMWLEESKNCLPGLLPPVFNEKSLKNIRNRYSTHEDYTKSFIPLLLLDLWLTICDRWRHIPDSAITRLTAICTGFEHPNAAETAASMAVISCEVRVPRSKDVHSLLKEGDLVIVQTSQTGAYEETCSERGNGAKKYGYRIFGYLKKKKVESRNADADPGGAEGGRGEEEDHVKMKLEILVKTRPYITYQAYMLIVVTVVRNIIPELRQCRAVCALGLSPLCKAILAPSRRDLIFVESTRKDQIAYRGPLDDSQKELILKLTSSCRYRESGLFQIEGGPGTGKTHVVIAFILQILLATETPGSPRPKILYCSHSDVVADHAALLLKNYRQGLDPCTKYKLVRVGNLRSIKPSVRDISSHQLAVHNDFKARMTKEVESLEEKIKWLAADLENVRDFGNDEYRDKSAKLHDYVKKRETLKMSKPKIGHGEAPSGETESSIIENADVICTTCNSSGTSKMIEVFQRIKSKDGQQRVICIIDDAMQCKEAETIIPLQLGVTHLILAGDPQQLRSPVRNERTRSLGLNQSLFWRIMTTFAREKSWSPVHKLKVQYRMCPELSRYTNRLFYGGLLKDGCPRFSVVPVRECVLLIDNGSQGCTDAERLSRMESIAENLAEEVLNITGGGDWTLSVVTCYAEQAKTLKMRLKDGASRLEIGSIETLQGREFDVVLFLFDPDMHCPYRANVAVTRAKQSLLILTSDFLTKGNKVLNWLSCEMASRKSVIYVQPGLHPDVTKSIISRCAP